MDQDSGIIRESLLSLTEKPFVLVESQYFAAYKHYILTLQRNNSQDCVIFDTQKGTTYTRSTGLELPHREGFSFCYWRDNIFVLYGGKIYEGGNLSEAGYEQQTPDMRMHFLYVNENDGQISFTAESCDFTDPEYSCSAHSAHIYDDIMYIVGGQLDPLKNFEILKKFDLYEKTWSQCQTTGEIPGSCIDPTTVLFNGKIYKFGGYRQDFNLENRGGLLGNDPKESQQFLALFVLDLENMKWQQIYKDRLLPTSTENGFGAEVVGDKIYISHPNLNEFFIYDPGHLKRQTKKVVSDPLVASYQQLPYMEYLWQEKPFADVTFAIETEELSAHRVILLKCRYFQNMFKSGMIEANSNKINVPDISSANFKAILEYIYLDKIALTEALAMELLILADMYFLPNLKADCEKFLSEKLTIFNFVEVMKVAQTADSGKLEKRVVSFLTVNIDKIKQEIDIRLIPPELFIRAIIDLKPAKK